MRIIFEIPGEPMGKRRPRITVLGTSKFAHAYTPKETVNYENKVIFAFKEQCNIDGISLDNTTAFKPNCEISAQIEAYYPITKLHYVYHKRTGTTDLNKEGQLMAEGLLRPTKKPDCDNIAKICLDALNGIAYYDDSQIVDLSVSKYYAESPKVVITLTSKD